MAKWYGTVGFIISRETTPGVWDSVPEKRKYFGDLTRNHYRFQSSQQQNDDVTMQSELSIVCDSYALQNFQYIRYVGYMNALWKVTSVDVQYPRLILSIGGVYNGEQA